MQDNSEAKQRHTRTRRGCLTCRVRKKKCDERKPRCAACRRNMLPCEWPAGLIRNACKKDSRIFLCTDAPGNEGGQINHALQVIPNGRHGACNLTPYSTTLLGHFLTETINLFAATPSEQNPFMTILLPLSHVDDLLLHSLLAFSGAHLAQKEIFGDKIATSMRLHYSKVIGGLRREFANLHENDLPKRCRLLRILLIICYFEVSILLDYTNGVHFTGLYAY